MCMVLCAVHKTWHRKLQAKLLERRNHLIVTYCPPERNFLKKPPHIFFFFLEGRRQHLQTYCSHPTQTYVKHLNPRSEWCNSNCQQHTCRKATEQQAALWWLTFRVTIGTCARGRPSCLAWVKQCLGGNRGCDKDKRSATKAKSH